MIYQRLLVDAAPIPILRVDRCVFNTGITSPYLNFTRLRKVSRQIRDEIYEFFCSHNEFITGVGTHGITREPNSHDLEDFAGIPAPRCLSSMHTIAITIPLNIEFREEPWGAAFWVFGRLHSIPDLETITRTLCTKLTGLTLVKVHFLVERKEFTAAIFSEKLLLAIATPIALLLQHPSLETLRVPICKKVFSLERALKDVMKTEGMSTAVKIETELV
jgi:hypothetical protein